MLEGLPWEELRGTLERGWRPSASERRSNAGRPRWDAVLMFKVLVLGKLFGMSDRALVYSLKVRLDLLDFLGLALRGAKPDEKTIWHYRERLGEEAMAELFGHFEGFLRKRGFAAQCGRIVDASIVAVPVQHNRREENARIKAGTPPAEWEASPAKRRRKDVDARWTKKNGRSYYGYKNHICIDSRHKIIRSYTTPPASAHDGREGRKLVVGADNDSPEVYGDSAYRSQDMENWLGEQGLVSRINRKGCRRRPLGDSEKAANRVRSKTRARVEHVFGAHTAIGANFLRSIGRARAAVGIGLANLVYNFKRYLFLKAQIPDSG